MRENESLVELTREKNTGSWLQRLMPDGATQMAVSAEQDELAIGFEYRRKALQLAVDSKLQAVEEACNHVLVTRMPRSSTRRLITDSKRSNHGTKMKLFASVSAID
jgi:hypothetical protein